MSAFRIAVIPGDGIGQEVIPEGLRVLEAIGERFAIDFTFEHFPWGSDYYREHGVMMPANGLDVLRPFDAIYFGAVGWPDLPDHVTLWGLRLAICQGFDQWANVRPARLLPGVRGPLRDKGPDDFDIIVVRENSEGEYAGAGGRIRRGRPEEIALQTSVFSRIAVERVIEYAFDIAERRPRRKLTSITKSNAQAYSMTLWDEIFAECAERHPAVETESWLVDAATVRFVLRPETLDVVVASNLFADILTDLAGALSGSLGLAPSANLDPSRRAPAMFEPVHGSAPDIFGQGIANPIAAIWSAAMMLDHLEQPDAARAIEAAISAVTASGQSLTPDLGGTATTVALGDAIAAAVRAG
ncbi:MAG TPA: tartrate dehydrogenase [Thermomicrobiales bacterium]|jgi:tartrate dehydrogenase/decarboxylase/D-malate dehydrogenase